MRSCEKQNREVNQTYHFGERSRSSGLQVICRRLDSKYRRATGYVKDREEGWTYIIRF